MNLQRMLPARRRENIEQVVNEAPFLFEFELRGLKFNGAKEPVKGLELPEIMQVNRGHGTTNPARGFTKIDANGGAQGRTRNIERVVEFRQHGEPPNPAQGRTRNVERVV